MYYLAIDTCAWIILGRKHPEMRQKITDLVESDKVKILLPSVVVEEWNDHKEEKVINPHESSIRGKVKNARDIAEHLEASKADTFIKILDDFPQEEVENLARVEVEAIEALFNHSSTAKLEITDSMKLQAANFALEKKAPFHRDKNNMADALIILSIADYVAQQELPICIFISDNSKDFGSETNKTQIHQDFEPLFEGCELRYFLNVAEAIQIIEPELISDDDIIHVEETLRLEDMQNAIQATRAALAASVVFDKSPYSGVVEAAGAALASGIFDKPPYSSAVEAAGAALASGMFDESWKSASLQAAGVAIAASEMFDESWKSASLQAAGAAIATSGMFDEPWKRASLQAAGAAIAASGMFDEPWKRASLQAAGAAIAASEMFDESWKRASLQAAAASREQLAREEDDFTETDMSDDSSVTDATKLNPLPPQRQVTPAKLTDFAAWGGGVGRHS